MIAGLDPSTKRIGWAGPDATTAAVSIQARAGADAPARRLHELARALELEIVRYPPRPELVVLEGYSMGSPGRLSLIRLGEIGGVIRCRLFELGIPYVEVSPSSLKRFATGKGNAKKPEMIARALELSGLEMNDDEADAWHLRRIGRTAYGLEKTTADHELEVIASIDWPTLTTGVSDG